MKKITDHKFIPCFYEDLLIKYHGDLPPGHCLNPYGPTTCHKKDCERPREEHEA